MMTIRFPAIIMHLPGYSFKKEKVNVIYHFINKKIKILNEGNFAVVGDIFYVA
jgi:hypothetical protein